MFRREQTRVLEQRKLLVLNTALPSALDGRSLPELLGHRDDWGR